METACCFLWKEPISQSFTVQPGYASVLAFWRFVIRSLVLHWAAPIQGSIRATIMLLPQGYHKGGYVGYVVFGALKTPR